MASAGMPGTGIGFIFYMLLAVTMPFREVYLLLRGRSSWARWRGIGVQYSFVIAILLAMWGEAIVLSKAIVALKLSNLPDGPLGKLGWVQACTGAGAAAFGACLSLSLVVIAVQVARLVVRRNKNRIVKIRPASVDAATAAQATSAA